MLRSILLISLAVFTGALNVMIAQEFDASVSHMIVNEKDFTRDFYVTSKSETFHVPIDRDYYWYKSHRVHVTKGGQGGRLLHGDYREYYLNKNLKAFGKFRNGLKKGEWREWHDNGMLKSVSRYSSGKQKGTEVLYDSLGNISRISRYRAGKLRGWVRYYQEGQITFKEKYRGGRLVKSKENTVNAIESDAGVEAQVSEGADEQIEPKEERKRLRKLIRKLGKSTKKEPNEITPGDEEE